MYVKMELESLISLILMLYNIKIVAAYRTTDMVLGPYTGQDNPQMILFTYTGNLTETTRELISKMFPETFKNPNGCPVGITLFVVSQDSEPCSVHKLYVRGHEVALSGLNYTSRVDNWSKEDWYRSIVRQQEHVTNTSGVGLLDMVGMRSQRFFPGSNAQFEMLNENHFEYDSSLLIDSNSASLDEATYLWPFLMKNESLARLTCQGGCPNGTFDGLWQVPINRLFDPLTPYLTCAYLDECISNCNSSDAVSNLLVKHLLHVRNGKRAPLHVNIRSRTLASPIAVEGITKFLGHVSGFQDTWVVTIRQLVTWMKTPTPNSFLVPKHFWDCNKRVYVRCSERYRNTTVIRVNFSKVIDVNTVLMWQTVFFVVLYIVAYRYDKYYVHD